MKLVGGSKVLATMMSVQEYLLSSVKPALEYRDGITTQKAMPNKAHSSLQGLLMMILCGQGAAALPELTMQLSPTHFLIPDLSVGNKIEDPYPTTPVDLCIEILSPEERLSEVVSKCEEYHNWGVPYCWIVDPQRLAAWTDHKGAEPVRFDRAGVLNAGNLSANLIELFPDRSALHAP